MRIIPKPFTITNLKAYLNDTSDKHGDNDYMQFEKMRLNKIPISSIARAMHVSRDTIYDWIKKDDTSK